MRMCPTSRKGRTERAASPRSASSRLGRANRRQDHLRRHSAFPPPRELARSAGAYQDERLLPLLIAFCRWSHLDGPMSGSPTANVPVPALRPRGRGAVQGLPGRAPQTRGLAAVPSGTLRASRVIPVPLPDGRVTFVPVLGEAR